MGSKTYKLWVMDGFGDGAYVNQLYFKFDSLVELFTFIVIAEKNHMEEKMIFEMQGCE